MFRKLLWRLYDRFFDRVEDPFVIDPERMEWIRTHEAHKLRPVFGSTRRNARRYLQMGLLSMGIGVWFLASATWIPGYAGSGRWFNAGMLIGAGFVAVCASRLMAYLAYLRGEDEDRPSAGLRPTHAQDASGEGATR